MHRVVKVLAGVAVALAFFAQAGGPAATQASTGSGGVVLDGFGGLHPFGAVSVNTANAPYWPYWDIARGLAVEADGSGGWVLDGYGGVHPFGAAPAVVGGPYWPYWDIARAITMLPNGQGYILDGFGGLHPLNGAPLLTGGPYWPYWDIARGLDIHTNSSGVPDGGWILDGYGGVHNFGAAPALSNPHYYAGFDVFRQLHVVPGGAYAIARYGIVETVGSPAGTSWAGYPSWGSWDIARDVVPLNPSSGTGGVPFPDRRQMAGMMNDLMSTDREQRGLGGLGAPGSLVGIAGNGADYNLAACGGPSQTIGDRTADMYARNYFAHPIQGCSTTQYVFSTYESGWSYHAAGENIAWVGGYSDPMDIAAKVNAMWLNSPEHYANIMGAYSSVGCGAQTVLSGSYQGYSGPISVWACEFMG